MEERDVVLYDKAYAYFEYHAGQRTNMINYFIGVFGACVALYGALISSIPLAAALISGFLFIVSMVFYFIDIRNKFDVKQSQEVLCAFEEKFARQQGDGQAIVGAFLHEEDQFKLYDRGYRKSNADLRALLRQKKGKVRSGELDDRIRAFVGKYPCFTVQDVKKCLLADPIPHLSTCIKFLYYLCMAISLMGVVFSVVVFFAG